MSIDILSRYTGASIYSSATANTIAEAVAEAVRSRADLSCANLSRANLSGAYLYGADLSRADLSCANLSRAYLTDAYLSRANLSRANLAGAYLAGAYLYGANLSRADLSGADLYGAYLSRAYLTDAKGLLNGVAPLQINGTVHSLLVRTPGFIQVGCEIHSVDWWQKHYRAVGRKNGYTLKQVTEYREHVKAAHNWMKITGNLGPDK